MAQMRRGELDDAAKSLKHATELNPQLPGAHLFLGIAEYQTGEGDEAAKDLRAEIALQPSNVEALTWLGIVELGSGHAEEATEPLDEAAALAPKSAEVLYYCGRAHNLVAEATYRKLYQLDPDSVFVHRALAETLASSGQPEKSIAEYDAAIKKDPHNADLYDALGEQDQKIGRIEAATTAYDEELKLNPHSAIAFYNLGQMQVKTGRAATGVPLLRRAQAEHAAAAPTDFYLGLGLAELGQNDEAAHWLELSLASRPSPFIEQSAYYQLARVYQKLNRKTDAEHALEQLKQLKAEAAKGITGGDGMAPDELSGPGATQQPGTTHP
jgi:tetratricopeptide (TPR) repeat protein